MTDAPELKVKIGAYSSVVGAGVHLHEQDGRFAGQIAIMCQTETLRDKALQQAMCEVIAKALEQFFAGKEASLQPDTDARQADLAKAWAMGRDEANDAAQSYAPLESLADSELSDLGRHARQMWRYQDARIRALTPPADLAAKIGGE